MKNVRSAAIAAGLALSLCAGCGKKEDPVKIIEEAENALPPAEQMPPEDRVVKPDAPAGSAATKPVAVPALPPEEGYEAWFKKHNLDLQDPQMLDADTDADGFTNRDEFMADTDPRDANSRPGIHNQMRLKQYTEVRLPVILEAVSGDSARVRRLDGQERTESVRPGQTIKGLHWKVERVQTKLDVDKNGEPVDLSSLTLTDTDTNERTILMKNLPTRTGDSFAELTSADGAKSVKVKQGDTFKWPDESGAAFKVIDLRADQIVVQEVATRKMWTIPKQ